jgi:Tol biopolymer transport system component
MLLGLGLGVALAGVVALAGAAHEARAAFPDKVVFVSERTKGTGVNNPTADPEIFIMNPDGSGLKQLTFNEADDLYPTLSPDGTKVVYESYGIQSTNPQGDSEIYVMNARDGSNNKNLTNNGVEISGESPVSDIDPTFSPDGTKIAYESYGKQATNPEGDYEVYVMNAYDGSDNRNLTFNGIYVHDFDPDFSPSGSQIAYTSVDTTTNTQDDDEVYVMDASDGSGKKNLTNNGDGINDSNPQFSPTGTKIAYESNGVQDTNTQGDKEIYLMNASDGSNNKNLTRNGLGVEDAYPDFSPGGKRIAYTSEGVQTSNPQGDWEVYRMDALDGTGKKNLSNNRGSVDEYDPDFSPDGKRIAYGSEGIQTSNPQGDDEIYRMNTLDGTGKVNVTNTGGLADDYLPKWGGR